MDENRGDVILETEHLCYSYDSRKTALQKAVDEEDYERAAQLRDQINQLKNNL